MFNKFTATMSNWYDVFININFSYVFLLIFVINFFFIFTNFNIVSLFFNILIFLTFILIFLFYNNVGAYAGFLFLCETVSLFTIFIILNKIKNDEVLTYLKFFSHNKLVYIFYTIILFLYYKLLYTKQIKLYDCYYIFESTSNNDFNSIFLLFFSNKYVFFLNITVFLLIFSYYIVYSFLFYNYIILKQGSGYKNNIADLLKNNNFILFKNKIIINFFKK